MAEYRPFHPAGFAVSWIARLFYLSALTVLIPFGAVLVTSGVTEIPERLSSVPLTALVLVLLSAFVLFIYHKSLAHTLASLGWMTLLPGVAGFVVLLFSHETIFDFLDRLLVGFDLMKPFLAALELALPKAWLFVIGYLLLGFLLIHVAGRMEHEHALGAQIKKLFGPRARILRSR